jgi:hypothetical protein
MVVGLITNPWLVGRNSPAIATHDGGTEKGRTVSLCCPIVWLTRLISLSLDDVFRPTHLGCVSPHPSWHVLP